jgi:hypothetical protein
VLVQLNGLGEFGEGRREPMARVDIHTEGTNVPDLLDVDQAAGSAAYSVPRVMAGWLGCSLPPWLVGCSLACCWPSSARDVA